MILKIKAIPRRFHRREISSRPLKDSRPIPGISSWKKGIDTFGAKRIIGKEFKIPSKEIGLAGLKDKHALTRQFVSFPSNYKIPVEWSQQSIKLKRLGFANQPILLGDLDANRFTLIVREVKEFEVEKVRSSAMEVF